jgi:hypothetical protein
MPPAPPPAPPAYGPDVSSVALTPFETIAPATTIVPVATSSKGLLPIAVMVAVLGIVMFPNVNTATPPSFTPVTLTDGPVSVSVVVSAVNAPAPNTRSAALAGCAATRNGTIAPTERATTATSLLRDVIWDKPFAESCERGTASKGFFHRVVARTWISRS